MPSSSVQYLPYLNLQFSDGLHPSRLRESCTLAKLNPELAVSPMISAYSTLIKNLRYLEQEFGSRHAQNVTKNVCAALRQIRLRHIGNLLGLRVS